MKPSSARPSPLSRRSLLAASAATALLMLPGCGGGGDGGSAGVGTGGTGSFTSGPIRGFGSIVVNGVRYDDAAAQVVGDGGAALARSDLRLGMVVDVSGSDVSTATDGRRSATATSIGVRSEIEGPVSAINAAAGTLTVLGQLVQITPTTVFDHDLRGGLAAVAVGMVVEVYGFLQPSGQYLATRIDDEDDPVTHYKLRGEDAPDVMYEADPSLAQADFSTQWREALTDEHAGRPDPDADLLAHARSLPTGTWVQFHGARANDSEIERGKLCWTSPYTGHGLFVNRNGVRLREASPEALAIELKSGDAFVIDHGRLLERTLRSLVEELQHAYELPVRFRED